MHKLCSLVSSPDKTGSKLQALTTPILCSHYEHMSWVPVVRKNLCPYTPSPRSLRLVKTTRRGGWNTMNVQLQKLEAHLVLLLPTHETALFLFLKRSRNVSRLLSPNTPLAGSLDVRTLNLPFLLFILAPNIVSHGVVHNSDWPDRSKQITRGPSLSFLASQAEQKATLSHARSRKEKQNMAR